MQRFLALFIFALVLLLASWTATDSVDRRRYNEKTKLSEVYKQLDDQKVLPYPDLSVRGASSLVGKKLVLEGFSETKTGKKSAKQSKHFVCTSCHNIEREDPDLTIADPQARLEFTAERGLPFLQGTTLYGAVNRTSFYNGDYDKKYGDLVKPARKDIREAIQLCAVECAQGRKLEKWELESVLAYLWTLELRLGDLSLTDKEYETITDAARNKANKKETIQLLQSKYLQASPATFVKPPENRKNGYPYAGNPTNGALIYDNSCLHCHNESRYSFFALDHSSFSLAHLDRNASKYSRYSLYQVGRYGTPPMNGKRAYMPQYTLERMSDQQMEDLRAYFKTR